MSHTTIIHICGRIIQLVGNAGHGTGAIVGIAHRADIIRPGEQPPLVVIGHGCGAPGEVRGGHQVSQLVVDKLHTPIGTVRGLNGGQPFHVIIFIGRLHVIGIPYGNHIA